MFQQFVDENRLGGAVAMVMRDGKVAYERAFGWRDKEAGRKMTPDTIFRIASQTKALTSVAILSLARRRQARAERSGRPLHPGLLEDDRRGRRATAGVKIVPARRADHDSRSPDAHRGHFVRDQPVGRGRLRSQGLGPAAGYGWYTADKDEPICTTMERLATLPFVAQPGEAWVYGYNTDILGCIAERASGMPLDELIRTRITGPLGMKDTQFFLPPAERDRLAAVYASGGDGRIARAPDGPKGQGNYVDGPRRSFAGGAGLLSTARDYARFLEMIRNGGTLDGVRILSPRSVELMSTNQVGTLHSTTGLGFGLGFEVTERYGANGMDSVGSFGWGGAYGSTYRVDPKTKMILVMMIQMLPNTTGIAERFNALVYQSLRDGGMK